MKPEKKTSRSITTFAFDIATGILAWSVIGVPGVQEFNARRLVGADAYDALNDLGKTALGHGFEQKLRDRAAIERDEATGKSASPQHKFEAVQALAEHLANGGAWNMKAGPRPINRPALYQAVGEVRGYDAADVERVYRDKPDEVVRTLLGIKAIAERYAALTAKGVETSEAAEALFAELDGTAQ